jgi:hypothetical protein
MSDTKREAVRLLRRYDKLRSELRMLEPALNKACADYGRSVGIYGYTKNHLRITCERKKP